MSHFQNLLGSPPRVWGRRRGAHAAYLKIGFTPTRVGKTIDPLTNFFVTTVHPHACGEDNQTHVAPLDHIGSPPRVWGRHDHGDRGCPAIRFTPTRVGKTLHSHRLVRIVEVHPHACGEDSGYSAVMVLCQGSPPRVWGRHGLDILFALPNGFTPTRVGKTISTSLINKSHKVHPHACGEDWIFQPRPIYRQGSPPRVWGRLWRMLLWFCYFGFTPTRVGKTAKSLSSINRCKVHPHACGEDLAAQSYAGNVKGSPPRVWGRRRTRRFQYRWQRFTPTRVGKTSVADTPSHLQ